MHAITNLVAAIGSAWSRLAARDAADRALEALGPFQCKEAGTPWEAARRPGLS
jgi:hypothetical protein